MRLNGGCLYGTFRSRLDTSTNRRFNGINDPNGLNGSISRFFCFNQMNQMNEINQISRFQGSKTIEDFGQRSLTLDTGTVTDTLFYAFLQLNPQREDQTE